MNKLISWFSILGVDHNRNVWLHEWSSFPEIIEELLIMTTWQHLRRSRKRKGNIRSYVCVYIGYVFICLFIYPGDKL